MRSHFRQHCCVFITLLGMTVSGWSQTRKPEAPDLSKQPTLYVVPYSHLDTQWRWEYPTTIQEYLSRTMRDNFALFEKYPHYILNFSGANRYRMMKEYYPADYERVKQYVAAGRWFPAGSAMEESDVNNPSAESIIRQILYGKEYFRRDFGKTSAEYMLPDCFGFPASLPSILAHTGIKGFSTQKLSWNSGARVGGPDSPEQTPVGIPFNVGFWQGPDGKGVIAALNAMSYGANVVYDISKGDFSRTTIRPGGQDALVDWPKRVDINGRASGVFADYYYYGIGDRGGSPRENSVKLMEAILSKNSFVFSEPKGAASTQPVVVGNGPLRILQTSAEQMFLDIKPEQMAKMPRYQGDIELVEHSAGSLTSQAYVKRWNRQSEALADAAERASIAAEWLGGREYPKERLTNAWTLVMGGQFHDNIPGTATPKAYEYVWNDQILAMNQFASVLTSATEAIVSGMNTQVKGTPVVVYNPLNIAREDLVEAAVPFDAGMPKAVRVVGPDGREVPAQISGNKALFLAKVPSVGYAVFDVQSVEAEAKSSLKVSESSLENARYRVTINSNGDIASILDKATKKELLSAPARLAFKTDRPERYPAWNIDWADQKKVPRAYAGGPAKVRIVENGPARVALEVTREAEGSKFVQTIRLSAGDAGNRLEIANAIDWKTSESNLKASFPLTASNPMATYNWEIGTIQRGNNDEKKYEVASHQWFDLTDKSGSYGVTVLSGCKNGSDKPDDNTVQLTLLRTPGIGPKANNVDDQATQDWGHHEFVYGIAGHAGDWRREQTDWQGYRLNQPLMAFGTSKHDGALGKTFSLLRVSNDRVRLLAVKKAEQGNEVVVRLVEISGEKQSGVRTAFAAPITAAREINGAEEPVGPATVSNGELVVDFTPYQPRTFALKLAAPANRVAAPHSEAVTLPYDRVVATPDYRPAAGSFEDAGRALPAEMMPVDLPYAGIHFTLAPPNKANAVTPRGQTIALPQGKYTRLYLLAAAAEKDQKVTFRIDDKPVDLTIQKWTGYIGQWDNRNWEEVKTSSGKTRQKMVSITPAFTKRTPVAWFASHRHGPDGANEAYAYSYLYAYTLVLPENAKTLILPENEKVRILAATVSAENTAAEPVAPLYDAFEPAANDAVKK